MRYTETGRGKAGEKGNRAGRKMYDMEITEKNTQLLAKSQGRGKKEKEQQNQRE